MKPMPLAVILAALPVEYLAVRKYLNGLKEEMHPQGTIYERGQFVANNQSWEVGIAEVGTGNTGTAVEAERALNYFKPDVLFFVGVADGIKDVDVGDVIAATKVYGYESGKVGEDGFVTRPALGQSTYAVLQRAKSEARKGEWVKRIPGNTSSKPQVFVAPIAAGEKVVASRESELFQFLRASYNDAIAVEMEGYGFLQAAFAYPNIQTLVIRGISALIKNGNTDNPEKNNEENRQECASTNASAYCFELLSKLELKSIRESAYHAQKNPYLKLSSQAQTQSDIPTPKTLANNSDKDILKLHNLLLAKKYKEADKETAKFLLKVVNKLPHDCLTIQDLPNIQEHHLQVLSNVWKDYTDGKLGFKKQVEIWHNLGGKINHEMEIALGNCFGWRTHDSWKEYSQLNFSINNGFFEGQFPAFFISEKCWRGELFLVNFLNKVSLSS